MQAGPHARIAVERSQAHALELGVRGVADEDARAAVAAEDLPETALGPPGAQPLLAADDAQRPGLQARRGAAARARPVLAAGAMAVERAHERRVDLEAHRAAA